MGWLLILRPRLLQQRLTLGCGRGCLGGPSGSGGWDINNPRKVAERRPRCRRGNSAVRRYVTYRARIVTRLPLATDLIHSATD